MGADAPVLISSLYETLEGSKCHPKGLVSPAGETAGPRLGDGCASSPASKSYSSLLGPACPSAPSISAPSLLNLNHFFRLLCPLTVLMRPISRACTDFNLNEDSLLY